MSSLTIVIPAFNVERFIESTLHSISLLRHKPEVLVIDDCSTDSTAVEASKAIARFGINGRVVSNAKNIGLSATRNRGLAEAKGEFINFLDGDDFLEPDDYDVLMDSVIARGVKTFAIGTAKSFWEKSYEQMPFSDSVVRETFMDGRSIYSTSFERSPWLFQLEPSTCTKIFHTAFLRQTGISFPEGRVFEDYIHHFKTLKAAGEVVVCNLPLVNVRIGRQGQLTESRGLSRFDLLAVMNQELPAVLEGLPEHVRQSIATALLKPLRWCGEMVGSDLQEQYVNETLRLAQILRSHISLRSLPHYVLHSHREALFAMGVCYGSRPSLLASFSPSPPYKAFISLFIRLRAKR
jgi:hypothetical protein